MTRLPHHCAICVCLLGVLLLLPLSRAATDDQYDQYDYDATPSPDYDYNATFDYTFFSNTSTDVLERFLTDGDTEEGEETETTVVMATEVVTSNPEVVTKKGNQASRAESPILLLSLGLAANVLVRLL